MAPIKISDKFPAFMKPLFNKQDLGS